MDEAGTRKRLPPGQVLTEKWPVLTYGGTPRVDLRKWTFQCFGLVEKEVSWSWPEFQKLPRVTVVSDIHCVTRWSKIGNRWEGVAPGFWEVNGYHMRADPWKEERYSDQETDAMQRMRSEAARRRRRAGAEERSGGS
jgi:DMSO/TMAO reductase YedYZ molybdopterin-dependent catalytic subunit